MCNDSLRYRGGFRYENRGEAVRPGRFAFASVEQETGWAPTHKIGVRSFAKSALAKMMPANI